MAKSCAVCASPAREVIDRHLLDLSCSNRAIARRFSVSRWSVDRHVRNHLQPLIEANRARYERRIGDRLDEAADKIGRFATAEVDRLLTIGLDPDPRRRWSGKAMRARHRLWEIALGAPHKTLHCEENGSRLQSRKAQ
jgi:hypothetical protein